MSEKRAPRLARKGTKSCTECRQRKVACTWSSKDATSCRRCEERGSLCAAQVLASPSTTKKSRTTRDRVTYLEQRIAGLTRAAETLGLELRPQSTDPQSSASTQDSQSSPASDTDDHLAADFPVIEPPAYLNSLFNNGLICLDNHSPRDANSAGPSKALTDLRGSARTILQSLIPRKSEVCVFFDVASSWLLIFHTIYPLGSFGESGFDPTSQYEAMVQPDVDPSRLASWLLFVAVAVDQMPREAVSPTFTSRWPIRSHFSDAVAEAVDRTIVTHEGLSCSTGGIQTIMLLVRLLFARGSFLKAWLLLRQAIAIAELLGLHRTSDEHGAALWEGLCFLEMVNSMMFAYPSFNRCRRPGTGKEALYPHLSQLANIAVELQDAGDLSDTDLREKTVKLDSELRELALATPDLRGQREPNVATQLMQHYHSYITMRVHMTLSLRPDSPDNSSSRMACIEACLELIQRYVTISPLLPMGFPRRLLDLQAFTAVVILLLLAFSSYSCSLESAKASAEDLCVAMQPIAGQPSSDYGKQTIRTTRALIELLDSATDASMTMRVPLLGKVLVRRTQKVDQQSSIATSPLPCLPDPTWGPLSWSIENQDMMFYEFTTDDYEFENGMFDFI